MRTDLDGGASVRPCRKAADRRRGGLGRPGLLGAGLLCVGLLLGCQPIEPSATPTATRTPILPTATATPPPTATSTPTATPTLTPSPTLPPGLVLPPLPQRADACPPLQTDLYFLRDGGLWVCLAEGGTLDVVTAAQDAQGKNIMAYRVTPDQQRIAYVTDAGELYVLDRATREHTLLPTAGRLVDALGTYFEITTDGSTVIYLAWGVQTGSGPALEEAGSGVLLAASVDTPTLREQELGTCHGTPAAPCRGFSVAPDQSTLAVVDGQGLWLIDRAVPETPRLLGHTENRTINVQSWAPDGRWLLIDLGADGGPALTLVSTAAEDALIDATPLCPGAPCTVGTAWATTEEGTPDLWVTYDTGAQGCAAHVAWDRESGVWPVTAQCLPATAPLHPRAPFARGDYLPPDSDLAFLQGGIPGLSDGVYALGGDGYLIPIALLMQGAGYPDAPDGVLWSADGAAFLIVDAAGDPTRLGVIPLLSFWDVSSLLAGAHDMTWAEMRP